MQNQINQ